MKKKLKQLIGKVKSAKMDKTIVVVVERAKKHPLYLKSYKVSQKYYVHDEKNEAKKGDRVVIQETKPQSKTKRWKLVKVLKLKK